MEILEQLKEWVSPVIWSGIVSAVVAAAISIYSTGVANKASLVRLREQHRFDARESAKKLEHDAREKDEDRKVSFRRDVYMRAVEEAHAVIEHVGKLPVLPIDDPSKESDPLQSFLKANAKVWLVGDESASHFSRDMAGLMASMVQKAQEQSSPFRDALTAVRYLEQEKELRQTRLRQLDERIAEAKALGPLSAEDPIHAARADAVEEVLRMNHAYHQARASALHGLPGYLPSLYPEFEEVQEALVHYVCALRIELGLPANETRFLEQLKEMEARAMEMLKNLQ